MGGASSIHELALAYLLCNAKAITQIEFKIVLNAVRIADAVAADLHVRENVGGRDLVDIDSKLVDQLATWRSDQEDLEEDDPPEEDDPAEDADPREEDGAPPPQLRIRLGAADAGGQVRRGERRRFRG
jgi:hypothetical protein